MTSKFKVICYCVIGIIHRWTSKMEYAQSEQANQMQVQTKTKIDKSSANDATRHKEKEMVKKEVRFC